MLHQHTRLTTCNSPDARKECKYNLTKLKYIDTITEYPQLINSRYCYRVSTTIQSQILLQSIEPTFFFRYCYRVSITNLSQILLQSINNYKYRDTVTEYQQLQNTEILLQSITNYYFLDTVTEYHSRYIIQVTPSKNTVIQYYFNYVKSNWKCYPTSTLKMQ